MIFDLIKKNRTLRELIAGIALIAIICEILLLIFTKNRIYNSIGLIIGTLTSLICAVHMAWGIEIAVMLDEKSSIAISRKYTIIRYLLMCSTCDYRRYRHRKPGNTDFWIFVVKIRSLC